MASLPENSGTAPVPESGSRTKSLASWVAFFIAAAVIAAVWPGFVRTTIIFCITLGILVFVHEWGHYQFALWGGMKVNRFGIGFPPWVYTVRRNNIDYSLGALPIGGMVDIAGLGSEEEMVATAKEGAAGDKEASARLDSYRERNTDVPHGQKQFQEAKLGWRFMTLFAGPLMNFLFAMVVFVGIYSIVGVPIPETTTRVDAVQSGMPASKAGIKSGDVIVAVNGQPVKTTNDIAEKIRTVGEKPVAVTLKRDNETINKTMTPRVDEVEGRNGKIEKAPLIGVEFTIRIARNERVSFGKAVEAGTAQALGITQAIFGLLQRAFTGNLNNVDKRSVGGPVRIAQTMGRSVDQGWQTTMLIMGSLSVNLGLLNLLPFPALDGGRILFVLYEGIMRRPFDPRKEGLVHMVGMVMLLAFMLFITFRDVLMNIVG
jgi:regulator of sigma E protease